RDHDGKTPLITAAERGQDGATELLLAGGSAVDVPDNWRRSPLHYAVKRGNIKLVESLLNAGANPNVKDSPDDKGTTPLHIAAESGNKEIVAFLLRHRAYPYALNTQDRSPLDLAVFNGHTEVAELMRQHCSELLQLGLSSEDLRRNAPCPCGSG